MPSYTTADIRNITLVGHGGCGKTSLTEALLKAAGAIHQVGTVDKGTTVSDYTDEEKEAGSSFYSAVTHCDFEGKHINIIDTPGGGDFTGQAITSLYAADTAVIVVNATAGIEPNTRRMFQRAAQGGRCRMIVINKIDSDNIDLPGLVEAIRESFGSECLPINLPTGGGSGVIDVYAKAEGDSDFSSVEEAHTAIVEQVVEMDDNLVEKYFEEGEIAPDELHGTFEKALREGHLVPICFAAANAGGSGTDSVGIDALLKVIADLAPNPGESNPRQFSDADGENEVTAEADPSKPAIAHGFKVVIDRFGRMGVLRVHQGTINKDTPLYIGDARKPVKLGHLYKVQGKDHSEVDQAVAGDIFAVLKVDDVAVNVVLHEEDNGLVKMVAPPIPEPMFGKAITAKKRGEEGKIGDAIAKLEAEDPTFKRVVDPTTGETVIYGVGEQHLRLVMEKMKAKYGVEVDTHPPKIAYKETVTKMAEGHHRHKKQTGGAGQFGEVYCKVEPADPGQGLDFVDELVGESIPRNFLPAIRKGVEQAMQQGALAGCPMQDVRIRIYDGKHHPVDSKEVAFVTAGKRAFLDGFHKAKPVLLEPIVTLEVTVPTGSMGDINSDLSGKRGRVQGTDMLPGDMCVITAQVPLAEVSNYQSQLKSVTAGQGSYTMELSHYEAVPPNVQQQIVAQHKPREEED